MKCPLALALGYLKGHLSLCRRLPVFSDTSGTLPVPSTPVRWLPSFLRLPDPGPIRMNSMIILEFGASRLLAGRSHAASGGLFRGLPKRQPLKVSPLSP